MAWPTDRAPSEAKLSAKASRQAESLFIQASDGLALHVRAYRAAVEMGLPVVCLPGLARTEADFEILAGHLALASQRPRQVFALDYRGRGLSSYDPDWRNYNLAVELADVIVVLTALGIHRAIFLGTSRGGLLTMLLAASHRAFIAGAILNDIGPVIEPNGLMRIKGYIGKLPVPHDFAEGAETLRRAFGGQFPALPADDWLAWSKRNWTQTADGLVARYDTNLAKTLGDIDPHQPIPPLWEQFDAVSTGPVMAIRGGLSDLLSRETVEAMRERQPLMEVVVVPDQGHAPLLSEAPVLGLVDAFCRRCDAIESAQQVTSNS